MAKRPGLGKSVHSDEESALRALLVAARESAGFTQQRLAQRLRKPQSFVAKYERGERRLDVIEFIAIARNLGADPVKLLRALVRRI
jgi:transcriptional regulator with XRE-family HTH domain